MILGASGLGKVALDIFKSRDILVYCFLDDDKELHGTTIDDISILGKTTDDGYLKYIGQKCEAFVAVDDLKERQKLVALLVNRRKMMPVNAVHDRASISDAAHLGHGNFLNAGAVVSAGATVPNHCLLHANSVVEYDATLGDFVQLGTGAIVGPKVQVGEGVLIGAGAILSPGIKIGKGAQVGPGSFVMSDVAEKSIVFGSPAKKVS